MDIQALIKIGLGISIFLAVLAEGIVVSGADARYLFAHPARLARTVLAMNVLLPIVALVVSMLFSLHPAVIIALVTLAIAPVGALFPQGMVALVGARRAVYAHGLFFACILLSVVLTPLAAAVLNAILGGNVQVRPLVIAQVAIGSLLVPLLIGRAVRRWLPAGKRWVPVMQKLSTLLLLVCVVAYVIIAWPKLELVMRQGTLAAIAIITLFGLAIGHSLGGPDEDDRSILACATVSRHPGVAVAVASLTQQPLAPLGVLLAVVVTAIAVLPYKRWRKKQHAKRSLQPVRI